MIAILWNQFRLNESIVSQNLTFFGIVIGYHVASSFDLSIKKNEESPLIKILF